VGILREKETGTNALAARRFGGVKLPAFQFYPGDWLKDPEVSRCSSAARGVLMDALCLMWESIPRGVLMWTEMELAQAIRGDAADNLVRVKELLRNHALSRGVFAAGVVTELSLVTVRDMAAKKDAVRVIFSRRMVRDEERRKTERVRQQRFRGGDTSGSHGPVTAPSQRSSSSSSTSNTSFRSERDSRVSSGKKWIDADEERRRKNSSALDRVFPEPEKMAGDPGRNVSKKRSD
jgi:hypothetical protein